MTPRATSPISSKEKAMKITQTATRTGRVSGAKREARGVFAS
jgi:hypothetical protein